MTTEEKDKNHSLLDFPGEQSQEDNYEEYFRFVQLVGRFIVCRTFFGISFEERSTITNVPLQGEDFLKHLFTHIPIGALVLPIGGWWSTERMFGTAAQAMNHFRNPWSPVFFRNYRLFVEENDLSSKSNFMLLSQLLLLQAVGLRAVSPVLTFSVGG